MVYCPYPLCNVYCTSPMPKKFDFCFRQNLRFTDIDTDANQLGGTIYWEKPAAGVEGYDYAVYLSKDSGGSDKAQLPIGAAHVLGPGAETSAFSVPMDTAKGDY